MWKYYGTGTTTNEWAMLMQHMAKKRMILIVGEIGFAFGIAIVEIQYVVRGMDFSRRKCMYFYYLHYYL